MRHKKTASSFVNNVQRAMRVAGTGEGEYPERMTQAELSSAAGMARSTIALHKELDADENRSPNPTLENICRIAETLNVPPAFLLMRTSDWVKLAQAIDYYARLRESKRAPRSLAQLAENKPISPTALAQLAFDFAKELGIDGRVDSALLESFSIEDRRTALANAVSRRLSIFATSSLPPIKFMRPDERIAAFTISVIFGAHHKFND